MTNTEDPIDLMPILKRRMVWDIIPCESQAEFIPKMGLLPGSDSGNTFEHKDSHRRLNTLAPINTWLQIMTAVAGEVAGRAILESQGVEVEGTDDPHLQHYMKTVYSTTCTVVANLIDYGFLHVGEGAVKVQ